MTLTVGHLLAAFTVVGIICGLALAGAMSWADAERAAAAYLAGHSIGYTVPGGRR